MVTCIDAPTGDVAGGAVVSRIGSAFHVQARGRDAVLISHSGARPMKTIIKKMLTLGLIGLGMAVVGCAQDNETANQTDPTTGKKVEAGVTPPTAARSSKDFAEKNKGAMNDSKNAADYKKAQQ